MSGPDLEMTAVNALAGLDLLRDGNARFLDALAVSGDPTVVAAPLVRGEPYAIVLGCSDSRVPPELIFDETVGRLFVVRVAANVAGQAEIGSIEYAVARWSCPLVVVLGHTQCGGVAAALDRLPSEAETPPDPSGSVNLGALLSSIRYNLGPVASSRSAGLWLEAVTLNVRRTIESLLVWSLLIQRRVNAGELTIRGALYHVETGAVEFLED